MADVEAASAAPGEKRSVGRPRKEVAPPKLLKASDSGDPAVHYLLAVRQQAAMNDIDATVEWATAELAKLGFE